MGSFGFFLFPLPQIQHDNQESEGNVARFWSPTWVNKWDYVNVSEGLTPRSSQWEICWREDEAIPPWLLAEEQPEQFHLRYAECLRAQERGA